MIAGEWQDHLMFAKLADEHVPTYLTEAAATKRSGGHRLKRRQRRGPADIGKSSRFAGQKISQRILGA